MVELLNPTVGIKVGYFTGRDWHPAITVISCWSTVTVACSVIFEQSMRCSLLDSFTDSTITISSNQLATIILRVIIDFDFIG